MRWDFPCCPAAASGVASAPASELRRNRRRSITRSGSGGLSFLLSSEESDDFLSQVPRVDRLEKLQVEWCLSQCADLPRGEARHENDRDLAIRCSYPVEQPHTILSRH